MQVTFTHYGLGGGHRADYRLLWSIMQQQPSSLLILTYNDRDVTHLHMMMILSGAWPQARRAWPQATAWQGPGAACGCKASAGASLPAGPGYGLREIQGRESSGGAASSIL